MLPRAMCHRASAFTRSFPGLLVHSPCEERGVVITSTRSRCTTWSANSISWAATSCLSDSKHTKDMLSQWIAERSVLRLITDLGGSLEL